MIVRRFAQTIFRVVEVCGILLVSVSVVLLFLLSLARLGPEARAEYNISMFWHDLHFPQLENAQKIAEHVLTTVSQFPAWVAVLIAGAVVYVIGRIGHIVVEAFRLRQLP